VNKIVYIILCLDDTSWCFSWMAKKKRNLGLGQMFVSCCSLLLLI